MKALLPIFALSLASCDAPDPVTSEAPEPEPVAEAEPVNAPGMSAAEFAELQTGMSYADAIAVIGSEGELLSENEIAGTHTVMYQWEGESGFGANANAMFQDDKLIQKSQFGLE
ncbi:hypothetical protein HME9302_00967 [Alteripontixanthobacter maritimus]|uniref:Lipoprotein SmpA/OmlA domain-containing protein n=1 Tax=Alteripontixanthobacter maritimus TaxID=2161824 RepID=A0A369Q5K8_9SPHN|nr:hypothetical protein [Alteripontixanthobacter maritimus]RDC59772.1 hypothetical protein HME9302_00967 [Alteripontixanthobacter maritimus]